ncbi:MAG: ATP-binding cassette domain-containing protein [Candidatus Contendobacter sp.]|jgi:putative spermidine/putrescine transport system ATP-binding protein|nr:ATP-binding cassette domain-containing protein [Gammaproteobacteria bacterium]MCC8995152.1 ATP-binding cassette domain-containing protein [Candidatus Contendobacter sp.]
MAEPLVRVVGLTLNLRPIPQPFDFQAGAGELWMLLGAVASGRGELIRVIAGLDQPQAGRIELFGADLERLSRRASVQLRSRIGVVLEQTGLVPAWSVFENLALLIKYHGLAPDPAVEDHVVKFVEVCKAPIAILSKLACDLSPLESRWVGLLRALIIRPRLLLVSAYLPQETLTAGYDVWTFFEDIVVPMNMTILVDAGPQALPMGPDTRLLVMDQGTLRAAGLASELAGHPDPEVRRYARFSDA